MLHLLFVCLLILCVVLAVSELSTETRLIMIICSVTYLSYQFIFLSVINFVCVYFLINRYKFRFRKETVADIIYYSVMEMIPALLITVLTFTIILHGSSNVELSKLTTSIITIVIVLMSFTKKLVIKTNK